MGAMQAPKNESAARASPIRALQRDAADQKVSVASLLRKAKIIATKLNQPDALVWIDRELSGYSGAAGEGIPEYRSLTGELQALNPVRGWQPILFHDAEMERVASQCPIGASVGSIEQDLATRDASDEFAFSIDPKKKAALRRAIGAQTDVRQALQASDLYRVVEAVRNLILNWSLELEKAGVVGEGLEFEAEERSAAGAVTNFFVQNVGVLGNVGDQATVTNQLTANATLNLDAVRDLLDQARGQLAALPAPVREQLDPLLGDAGREMAKPSPDRSIVANALRSVRTICEGAAGNLVAEGLVALIGKLLPG